MCSAKKNNDYSYKKIFLASVLLFHFCFPAIASADDDYTVDKVSVDSDGKDTADARSKALTQGEAEAFRQFVVRRAPSKSADLLAKTTTSEISRMIGGFEILEEKITPGHYHALVRYNFSPGNTQAIAAEPQSPKSPESKNESVGQLQPNKAVLILPVYKEGAQLKLWQDDNKWRNIWYEAALESGNGLVIMPLGNLDDRVDVDDTNVESATAASLSRMYGHYGVGEIYVLFAFFNKKADPKPTLEVTMKKLLPGKEETSKMDYIIRSTENLDTLMARAANDIAQHIYKIQTINPNKIEYDRLKEINARVNASDIKEWEALRRRLLAHGNIMGIKLTSISFYETSMTITFKGTPDMLGKTLVASGLRVMKDGDNLVLVLK